MTVYTCDAECEFCSDGCRCRRLPGHRGDHDCCGCYTTLAGGEQHDSR